MEYLNSKADLNTAYKVLFMGRHGEGFHNAAESYYGTPSWNVRQLSLREQIALKRAEAKKVSAKSTPTNGSFTDLGVLEEALPEGNVGVDIVDLGRWSVKETIERARSTGGSVSFSNPSHSDALTNIPSFL